MRILVTGGAGFIGSNFIHYWLQNHSSDQIVNFDKLTYAGNLENLKNIRNNENYTFVKGDIASSKDVTQAMKGIDIVINFAAETHVDRSILDPAPFVITNVVGTQVLLDAAAKAKIKHFHHVSTDEVFGALDLASRQKFSEETNYNPRSPYAATKAASDHLVRAYFATYNLPVTISNCSNNFGPYQFPEKLISLSITNLLEGKKVPVYGDGLYVRDWLYVEDHASAIDLVLQKGKIGETYCIGQDNDIANIEVIKKILAILAKGESMIEYVKDRPGHDRRYAMDATRIKKELGWHAKYDFDMALELTIKWYQQNTKWWKKLKDRKFEEYYEEQYVKR
ncbi:dTDP-glucose 4,6-dehydratase [Candidatus Curtissbacteria bacterium RIFCSPHIGHO2_01_FULL_41_44]|uniref:dTDP-glucose 4,6-dehydratase n=1 Tax=Candidatus Curtissbacteria bacterium RIFCSPLOWO2_01_FULL_42_50 TaxID=1797730 RepID=A0A1F5H2R1_9BACT|nr:MAG: dTDP-glucose 4,6-dehydratase [Candidatus Curtissbacteria bacterium RIFCSPHIGHO2_02_FULL_42_58]OGD94825.1 MAG: dTDP-glucose 4,6-dehydratase [Candidatus Curtissbacteria bacterium RIFCSPHIGHO2_01_FULL_41_44]OGD96426.1 MAG: dTDP-glucose 4,6-dehydratase [Candidatus Curtissbacteria bacterium RIFCSPHIGHO2_12_FULL_42_33]OGD98452.1 MAG: dTDP-glucose 4,6-dehydratase [Candidatus Curtissbacteria bacterium RIFCSPLOWO2_01_FULL_42_50]OGE02682.1 MAG: dTDP-glucose 4,6-dehydratase [Candidatus Curtissbact